jgi:hypothetical protein
MAICTIAIAREAIGGGVAEVRMLAISVSFTSEIAEASAGAATAIRAAAPATQRCVALENEKADARKKNRLKCTRLNPSSTSPEGRSGDGFIHRPIYLVDLGQTFHESGKYYFLLMFRNHGQFR